MTVVFDTNVFVSAAASVTGPARLCFFLWARHEFQLAVTQEVLDEYRVSAEGLSLRPGKYRGLRWRALHEWVTEKAVRVEGLPLGKQRSRDVDDDIFLSCALAARAKRIVTYDSDLLVMKKPFGIEILKPSAFIESYGY